MSSDVRGRAFRSEYSRGGSHACITATQRSVTRWLRLYEGLGWPRLLLFIVTDAFAAELPYGRLTPFDPLTPLPSASARNMIFDAQGQAWFTVYSSGVGYYTGDALKLFTTEDGLSSVTVNGIGIDADGIRLGSVRKGGLGVDGPDERTLYRAAIYVYHRRFEDLSAKRAGPFGATYRGRRTWRLGCDAGGDSEASAQRRRNA